MGVRWFPVVGWAERGGYLADGHGNSVPRFHVTWGTGPGVVAPFERRVQAAVASGRVELRFRHRVDELTWAGGGLDGVRGAVLEPSFAARGTRSSPGPTSRTWPSGTRSPSYASSAATDTSRRWSPPTSTPARR